MDDMLAQRIAQFENMCEADPDNEMAHFSLGRAYTEAGRHDDAAQSFLNCIDKAPGMSKAYQLGAESFRQLERAEEAAELATKGYTIAAERGDVLPRDAMKAFLEELGRPIPEVAGGAAEAPIPDGSFICQSSGRPGTEMTRAPFKGPAGEWILANISNETFQEWIGQGTKVINELRLDLSRDEDSQTYDEHMREFLGIPSELFGGA